MLISPATANEVSGTLSSESIRSTRRNASMAHSIMPSSGSRVVKNCNSIPGALKIVMIFPSVFESARRISYETPATSGKSSSLKQKRSAASIFLLPTYSHPPTNEFASENTRMLTSITRNKKVVPHLSCRREQPRTFSTLSSSPCSYAVIVLCSAPWHINTRLSDGTSEISARYKIKIPMRTPPSARLNRIPPCSVRLKFVSPVTHCGSATNSPTARTMPRSTEIKLKMPLKSILCFSASHFSAFEGVSSSSSATAALRSSTLLPTIKEEINATTPRTSGRRRNLLRFSGGVSRSLST